MYIYGVCVNPGQFAQKLHSSLNWNIVEYSFLFLLWMRNEWFFVVVINFIQSNLKFITTQTNQQSTNQISERWKKNLGLVCLRVCACVCDWILCFFFHWELSFVVKKNKNINVCNGHLESKFEHKFLFATVAK